MAKLLLSYTSYRPVGAEKLETIAIVLPPKQSGDEFGFSYTVHEIGLRPLMDPGPV